jgi:hypothetical protein
MAGNGGTREQAMSAIRKAAPRLGWFSRRAAGARHPLPSKKPSGAARRSPQQHLAPRWGTSPPAGNAGPKFGKSPSKQVRPRPHLTGGRHKGLAGQDCRAGRPCP